MPARGKTDYPLSIVLQALDHTGAGLKSATAKLEGFSKNPAFQKWDTEMGLDRFIKASQESAEQFRKAWAPAKTRTITERLAALNERFEAAHKPLSNFRREVGRFFEASGLTDLGSALGRAGRAVKSLAIEFGLLAGAGFLAAKGLADIYEEGHVLADTAERIGLSVDALAQLRYAAKRSGLEVGELDGAMQTFANNLGAAKGGTGRFFAFLKKVAPRELIESFKHAKGPAEAFDLMVESIGRLQDPAKRLKLVTAAFGDPKMVNLLARGKTGIDELRARFIALHGSVQGWTDAAEPAGNAVDDIEEAFKGLKEQLAAGLAPTFTDLGNRLAAWLGDPKTRASIAQWATDFGEKLPARLRALRDAFNEVWPIVQKIWNAIGGAKGALILFAAVKLAPLASALGGILLSIGKIILSLRAARVEAAIPLPAGGGLPGPGAGVGLGASRGGRLARGAGRVATAIPVVGTIAAIGLEAGEWASKRDQQVRAERQAYLAERPELAAALERRVGKGNMYTPWGNIERRFLELQQPTLAGPTQFFDMARNAAAGQPVAGKLGIEVSFEGMPRGARATVTDQPEGADVGVHTGYQLEPAL